MDGDLSSDKSTTTSLVCALRPLFPPKPDPTVIALTGAGGKTSALFGLADELASQGHDVLMTTTTHLADPRLEADRPIDRVVIDSRYAQTKEPVVTRPSEFPDRAAGHGRRVVLAAAEIAESGKLRGIDSSHVAGLARHWPFIILEADGAQRKPIKAPATHEPVLPPDVDLLLGLIGLDCLGQAMNAATVHRPELFGPLTACPADAPIQLAHLAALANSPIGVFKNAPPRAQRVLVLNKADRCELAPEQLLHRFLALAPTCADRILICTLHHPDPEQRVLAQVTTGRDPAILARFSSSGAFPP